MLTSFKEIIIGLFIFCIILFLYLHIQFHLKTGNDLEIYEIEQASKDRIEEICDLRQPVLLNFSDEESLQKIINTTNKQFLLDNYPVFEVKIRHNIDIILDTDMSIPLPLHVANKLFKEDTNSAYFSEGNSDFLQETGAIKNMSYNDEFLRPSLVSNCHYDVLFGSTNVETPFRYDLNYRNYYIVTQGAVKIKLAPPKSVKYLYPIDDYENFEFRSPINPWNPQTKYKADFDKIKCLEIVLTPGKILYIPAYWWYTFKMQEDTSVSCFKYRTYMNNVAISPNICMYALQNQNVDRKIAKKIDINKLTDKKKDTTSIIELDLPSDNMIPETSSIEVSSIEGLSSEVQIPEVQIPEILIPREEPEPMPQFDFKENSIGAELSMPT